MGLSLNLRLFSQKTSSHRAVSAVCLETDQDYERYKLVKKGNFDMRDFCLKCSIVGKTVILHFISIITHKKCIFPFFDYFVI